MAYCDAFSHTRAFETNCPVCGGRCVISNMGSSPYITQHRDNDEVCRGSYQGVSRETVMTLAKQQRAECPRCGSDEHAACEPTCIYCQRPAVIESAIGLEDDDYTPRPEARCEECHEGFERVAARNRRLAQEGRI